jgi:hypothetical protein
MTQTTAEVDHQVAIQERDGTKMYNLADPKDPIFMVRPDRRRLIPMSYASRSRPNIRTTTDRPRSGR